MMDFWQVGLPESGNGGISWPNFALPRQTSLAASIPKPGQPQTSQSQSLCQLVSCCCFSAWFGPLLIWWIWWTYSGWCYGPIESNWYMIFKSWVTQWGDVRGACHCSILFQYWFLFFLSQEVKTAMAQDPLPGKRVIEADQAWESRMCPSAHHHQESPILFWAMYVCMYVYICLYIYIKYILYNLYVFFPLYDGNVNY